MRVSKLTYLTIVITAILLWHPAVNAQMNVKGTIGVDLNAIGASSTFIGDSLLVKSYKKSTASRFISNHYVTLSNKGYIKNDNFASYDINTTINGFFTSTKANGLKNSFYNSPFLNILSSEMVFFPKRSYPFRVFYYKLKDIGLRYNESNRSKTNILFPGLAVIQKNKIDNQTYGTNFSTNFFGAIDFKSSYKKTELDDSYEYDFNENRQLEISTGSTPGDLFSTEIKVIFKNNIPDDSIRVISGTINEIIPPNFSSTIVFDTGFHTIDIIPVKKYIQKTFTMKLLQGEIYRINVDVDPYPVTTDNIKDNSILDLSAEYNGDKLNVRTSYSYDDSYSENIKLAEINEFINNTIKYQLSRIFVLDNLTDKNKKDQKRGSEGPQIVNSIKNSTSLSLNQRTGLVGTVVYDIGKDRTLNSNGITDTLTDNMLTSRLSYPSQKWNHVISLNSSFGKQEKTGQIISTTNQNSYEVSNKMVFKYNDIKLTPYNSIRINKRKVLEEERHIETNDIIYKRSKNDDINITTSLEGMENNHKLLGDVTSKISYTFNNTKEELGNKITKTFAWDAGITKKLSENNTISILSTHSWKSFSGDKNTKFNTTTGIYEPKASEYTSMNSIKFKTTQWENVNLMTSISFSKSPGNKNQNFILALDALLPYLNLPFTLEINNQKRKLEGFPTQKLFTEEALIRYAFSQITIDLTHMYSSEKLINDKFTYYEFAIKITRNFTF